MRNLLLALFAGLVGCINSFDLEQSQSDAGGDSETTSPSVLEKTPEAPNSDEEPCVVEFNGRCFNYDPRERMAASAYERAQKEKEDEVESIPAHIASSKHQASSWKRKIRYTEDPAIALARIVVSEEGFFSSPRARGAIWQVIANVRSYHCDNRKLDHIDPLRRITQCRNSEGTLLEVRPSEHVEGARETYLSAMRRLSPHVTGVFDPKRDRQKWTSTLREGSEAPAAWRQCVSDNRPKGCHGDWRLYEDSWSETLEWAQKIITGRHRPMRPCPAPVIAWGGVMDDRIAKARGLVRIDCGLDDALNNRFWAKNRSDPS